jgi:hypothetical protein
MVRAIAHDAGIELRSRSVRSKDFAVGRGVVRFASGRDVDVSLMILPVMWEAAAALVAAEARAARASAIVMCGVAGPAQPIWVETVSTTARVARRDAFGMRPRAAKSTGVVSATLDVRRACEAARDALDREALTRVVRGAELRRSSDDNAYVCNATAHDVGSLATRSRRMMRSSAHDGVETARMWGDIAHGFVHFPRDIDAADIPACARVLLALVDAVT